MRYLIIFSLILFSGCAHLQCKTYEKVVSVGFCQPTMIDRTYTQYCPVYTENGKFLYTRSQARPGDYVCVGAE